ncbi:MAG: insulinase family protein [Bacteroidia bacterium]|nr:insulinase family protein [Bacteroidia bacterium]
MEIAYERFELRNGLRVYVHYAPESRKAAVNMLYRVGSRHESEHRTGMAHLFEHLMFGGSRNVPDFDREVQRIGGESNAFTNSDVTNYYIVCPVNQWETALWLESDRMLDPAFSREKLDVQKSVVIEEFKQRYLNQPYGDAYLHLRPLHFVVHPYRWNTIGKSIEHIEAVSLEDVEAFFANFYSPANATLTVAGGIEPERARRAVETWFDDVPARPVVKAPLPQEPPQTQARKKTVVGNVPRAVVFSAFHIPARDADDYPAVEILSEALTGGKASRLYHELVKKRRLATNVYSFSWALHEPGMLSINAQLAPGVSPETYDAALRECLDNLADIAADEIERCINKIESADWFEKTTMIHRAIALAVYDALGKPELVNDNVRIMRELSVDQIRDAVRYFRAENSSTLYYLPKSSDNGIPH